MIGTAAPIPGAIDSDSEVKMPPNLVTVGHLASRATVPHCHWQCWPSEAASARRSMRDAGPPPALRHLALTSGPAPHERCESVAVVCRRLHVCEQQQPEAPLPLAVTVVVGPSRVSTRRLASFHEQLPVALALAAVGDGPGSPLALHVGSTWAPNSCRSESDIGVVVRVI
jgi:hypothetical protein